MKIACPVPMIIVRELRCFRAEKLSIESAAMDLTLLVFIGIVTVLSMTIGLIAQYCHSSASK